MAAIHNYDKKPNLVAISDFMKKHTISYFAQYGYNVSCEMVYNGIDLNKYPFQSNKTDSLLFVGRLSTFKQPHVAVEVARKTNHRLDIVGGTFVDSVEYVKQLDKMVENDPNIKIYKDVTHEFKIDKMKNAKALIFPSKMGEPFGLCLVPDSPILTLDRGVQKIKDIKVGDKVLTHKGRFMIVSQTMKREYSGDMIKINYHKLRIPTILTPDHRVLAIKTVLCRSDNKSFAYDGKRICIPGSCYYIKDGRQYKQCKYIKGEEPYTKYKTEWIKAKDLKLGDFAVFPRVNKKEIDIDKIRVIDYIDDFLNVRGDSYDDNTRQTDVFGDFTEKNIGLTNRFSIYEESQIPSEIKLTEDLMRLFGYWIAEGSIHGDRQIKFSFNINEDEYISDVEKLMKDIFGLEAEHIIGYKGEQSHLLRYSNKILSNMLHNMFSPKECVDKKGKGKKSNIVRIPPEFLNLPLGKLAQLIKGEWRGDGSDVGYGNGYSIKTTSETLAQQLIYILSRFGILPSIKIRDPRKSEQNKKWYKDIDRASVQYIVEVMGKDAQIFYNMIGDKCTNIENIGKSDSRYLKGKKLFYIPIKEIEIINYNGQVHNLEVDEDNSYVSPIVVHNCAVESMACGTPVISFNDGAISEIVTHNKTGFICNSIEDMVEAVNNIHTIRPEDCRKRAEELSRQVMAENYIKLYQRILNNNEW